MLYFLFKTLSKFGYVSDNSIFGVIMFRAALAILLGFVIVLAIGPKTIRWLIKQKIGDQPESHNKSLNELTKNKKNTPTMGGIMIIAAILASVLLLADITNFYVTMALVCMVYLACLGAIDDWLKLIAARRTPGSRDGLYAWEKMVFQIGLGVLLAMFIYHQGTKVSPLPFADAAPPAPTAHLLNWPFFRDLTLPAWLFAILTVIVITGSSNAVNLTDGMDGLAAGCMAIVSFAFLCLCYFSGAQEVALNLHFHFIPYTAELAVVCGAITGACLGFLWFNCNPAQVFMGDTGSLALGGVIGYIAIVIRQEPMLLLIGGIFVLEAASVMLQVGYFRMTGGKRIFLCAPIHHHFHLKGWSEQQVVVRFWLISALCVAFGLATVKMR